MNKYLIPGTYINSDHALIIDKADSLTHQLSDEREKSIALFYFVRDSIRYNPYINFLDKEVYIASTILKTESTFCVPKAVLLVALSRAAGIPARIGFADIRNHLMPQKMTDILGGDVIYGHGFAELYLNDEWIMATPAYDKKLCEDNGFVVTDFDAKSHNKLPATDTAGRKHIEYLRYTERYEDLPFEWLTKYYIDTVPSFKNIEQYLRNMSVQKNH